jgi:2,3-dihydroxyphenylpropionate 1,2-dioxygenase
VIEAAREFATGQGPLAPLNPEWDQAFLDILDTQRLADVDGWDNSWIAAQAGNSAHEVRTWVAAFAALAAQGGYQTGNHFYRAAPDLIAGFAIRTAVGTP